MFMSNNSSTFTFTLSGENLSVSVISSLIDRLKLCDHTDRDSLDSNLLCLMIYTLEALTFKGPKSRRIPFSTHSSVLKPGIKSQIEKEELIIANYVIVCMS